MEMKNRGCESCRWEQRCGMGARFIIPAGARRRLALASAALLEAWGRDFEAWRVCGGACATQPYDVIWYGKLIKYDDRVRTMRRTRAAAGVGRRRPKPGSMDPR
eukprot:scaffold15622_cov121-Isochrysis_galbana.AAC.1